MNTELTLSGPPYPGVILDGPPPDPVRLSTAPGVTPGPDPVCPVCEGRKTTQSWPPRSCPSCFGYGKLPGPDATWHLPYDPALDRAGQLAEHTRRLEQALRPIAAYLRGRPSDVFIEGWADRMTTQALSYLLCDPANLYRLVKGPMPPDSRYRHPWDQPPFPHQAKHWQWPSTADRPICWIGRHGLSRTFDGRHLLARPSVDSMAPPWCLRGESGGIVPLLIFS